MKAILPLILFLLLPLLLWGDVYLSDGGRIVTSELPTASSFTDSMACAGGSLALTHQDDSLPVFLRLYRSNGETAGTWSFPAVIRPVFSPQQRCYAFSDGKMLHCLNTVTATVTDAAIATEFAIDDDGNLATWSDTTGEVRYGNTVLPVSGIIRSLLWHRGELLVHTPHKLLRFADGAVLYQTSNSLHDVRSHNGNLYLSENRTDGYHLLLLQDSGVVELLCAPPAPSRGGRSHAPIQAPLHYGELYYPFPIGNSYLEIQDYGSGAYMHPGVDFLGLPYDAAYAVADGVVKAVLTTGGENYWRVAVALEDTNEECEGYLYAHLAQNSITVSEGDYVSAGDQLGNIVEWPIADFHHCHFARIEESGQVWSGAWWTTDDPLRDVTNLSDTSAPIFLNAHGDDLLAFRASGNTFADPLNLTGQVDIIARGGDYSNCDWLITFSRMGYRVSPLDTPDSVLVDQLSFTMDYPNDDYINGAYMNVCTPIIYSRTQPCYSNANYDEREYYYLLARADADSAITGDEAGCRFDTTQLPDGGYILQVWADDAAGNRTTASMLLYINNNPNEPPAFVNMPDAITLEGGQAYHMNLWAHVSDDATPDSALVFAFAADNDSLHWAYDGQGDLALYHNLLGGQEQTAVFTITATDGEGESADRAIDITLQPSQGIAEATLPHPALSCSPNPFNPNTTIAWSLAAPATMELAVYNVRGQKVRTLEQGAHAVGSYRTPWNGRDDAGHACAGGLYFCRLKSDGNPAAVRKMLLLK